MFTFAHYPLLWGLGIIAVPVLIHLINMLRHKRVPWAAMEFLLQSQKRNRTRVILKQLLLLLLRMLAIAAVVLIVAQPRTRNQWGYLLGTQQTHHIILLDDSFSMADHWGDTSAFEQGKLVIQQIGRAAARQSQPQSFTLLRFSRSGKLGGGLRADFTREPVDEQFGDRLEAVLKGISVSETAADPIGSFEAFDQLLGEDGNERRVVYLVSDFRAREWDKPEELKQRLLRLNEDRIEVHLVDCVEAAHANLAIVGLEPVDVIRTAKSLWPMQVAVQNFSSRLVRNVQVLLTEDGRSRAPVTISEIPAGGVAKEKFNVRFDEVGEHRIAARLEADAVTADNARSTVVEIKPDMPVLVIDGDPSAREAKHLSLSLAPGGRVASGVRPQIELPRFLATRALDGFRVIIATNFDRLDPSAVKALERHVESGGGLIFFVGDQTRGDFINRELYRDGKGVFPVPLTNPADLPVDHLDQAPDIQADLQHALFSNLENPQRNVSRVLVHRYFGVAKDWKAPTDGSLRVIMRLRNGAPLLVERGFGKGRVMAMLSTASLMWNNLAKTGMLYCVLREGCASLPLRSTTADAHTVGHALEVSLDPAQYQPTVRFVPPSGDPPSSPSTEAAPTEGRLVAKLPSTETAGFYQAQLTQTNGQAEVRHIAVNVDTADSDLRPLFGVDLARRLSPVQCHFDRAASFESDLDEQSGTNLGRLLLYLLIILLLAEQLLAWSASYHPMSRSADPKAGRRRQSGMQGDGTTTAGSPAPVALKGGAA